MLTQSIISAKVNFKSREIGNFYSGGVFMSYTIQQVAGKLGLTTSALRYYDKEGLLPTLKRTDSGIRTFSDTELEWLGLICCLKNSGMPIMEIKHFMNLCLRGEDTCEERRQVLEHHKTEILKQMEILQNSLNTVNYKIEHYKEIGIFHIDQENGGTFCNESAS
jgi:DNA-binding transcriptional MerR regulator